MRRKDVEDWEYLTIYLFINKVHCGLKICHLISQHEAPFSQPSSRDFCLIRDSFSDKILYKAFNWTSLACLITTLLALIVFWSSFVVS